MEEKAVKLRHKLNELLAQWEHKGAVSRERFAQEAESICQWRKENGVLGLWKNPPVLVTATMDDAWGHGLQIIESWAEALGLEVRRLGLLKNSGEIIRKCQDVKPDFLGMTILQFDSEDDIAVITANLPANTRLIAGGPLFAADPDLAERTGIHVVAKNAADFIAYMLKFGSDSPPEIG